MRLPIILSIITITIIVIIVLFNKKTGNKHSGTGGIQFTDNEKTTPYEPDPDNPLFEREDNKEKKRKN